MRLLALLLLVAPIASADTVDVFDYDIGVRSIFTDCKWINYNRDAICGGISFSPNDDRMPNVAGYSIMPITMHSGPFSGSWSNCALTDVHGTGNGTVYHRYDCKAQPILRRKP